MKASLLRRYECLLSGWNVLSQIEMMYFIVIWAHFMFYFIVIIL